MSLGALDHIGIAVRDVGSARLIYEALGLRCSSVEEVPSEGVTVAMFPLGDARIELLEPLDPSGTVAKFLEKRGEGLHHICLRVGDLDAALEGLRRGGLRIAGEGPRVGAGGRRVAFVHPASTGGVLLELVEAPGRG